MITKTVTVELVDKKVVVSSCNDDNFIVTVTDALSNVRTTNCVSLWDIAKFADVPEYKVYDALHADDDPFDNL